MWEECPPHVSKREIRDRTYPQPRGVVTPKKQSPAFLGTTCSGLMGVMTTPALTREAQSERRAAARVTGFMLTCMLACVVGG